MPWEGLFSCGRSDEFRESLEENPKTSCQLTYATESSEYQKNRKVLGIVFRETPKFQIACAILIGFGAPQSDELWCCCGKSLLRWRHFFM